MNTLPPAGPPQLTSSSGVPESSRPRTAVPGSAGGHPSRSRSPLGRRLLTVAAAAAAAVLVQLVVTRWLGIDLVAATAEDATQTVGTVGALGAAVVAGLAGWALLALVERVTSHARGVWTSVAVLVLAISLVGPLTMASGAAAASLTALHLVVGAVLVPGLSGSTRS